MMAPFYEILKVLSDWLVKKGIKRKEAQKYIASLFVALSEDSVVKSGKNLRHLVAESQTPGGLNEQGVKELRKLNFYKSLQKTLNSILKRLNKK
jgi:Pyrroline-5-carboxylate reductase